MPVGGQRSVTLRVAAALAPSALVNAAESVSFSHRGRGSPFRAIRPNLTCRVRRPEVVAAARPFATTLAMPSRLARFLGIDAESLTMPGRFTVTGSRSPRLRATPNARRAGSATVILAASGGQAALGHVGGQGLHGE